MRAINLYRYVRKSLGKCYERFFVFGCLFFLVSCVPSITRFEHIFVGSENGPVIVANEEIVRDGLFFGGGNVPVRYVIERDNYTIDIQVPPVGTHLYMKMKVSGKNSLGPMELASDRMDFNTDFKNFPYTFFLDKHGRDSPVNVAVIESGSRVIGEEAIRFEVVKIGYLYSVDAI